MGTVGVRLHIIEKDLCDIYIHYAVNNVRIDFSGGRRDNIFKKRMEEEDEEDSISQSYLILDVLLSPVLIKKIAR